MHRGRNGQRGNEYRRRNESGEQQQQQVIVDYVMHSLVFSWMMVRTKEREREQKAKRNVGVFMSCSLANAKIA